MGHEFTTASAVSSCTYTIRTLQRSILRWTLLSPSFLIYSTPVKLIVRFVYLKINFEITNLEGQKLPELPARAKTVLIFKRLYAKRAVKISFLRVVCLHRQAPALSRCLFVYFVGFLPVSAAIISQRDESRFVTSPTTFIFLPFSLPSSSPRPSVPFVF